MSTQNDAPAERSVRRPSAPPHRRLRVYAFDPGLSTQLDSAFINDVVLHVPWEDTAPESKRSDGADQPSPVDRSVWLHPGPVGEYLDVVDVDPASGCCYDPVDLNDPVLIAQDGLAPSIGNPQFHQQMVYAVAMATIHHFERALGRQAIWRSYDPQAPQGQRDRWTQRLRIYPHALRERNAFYHPAKRAILFGYFPAARPQPGEVPQHLPGGTVFTCLSHDIVAHETTHALLDGLHRRYTEPSNPDVLAFHEAFADMVAMFQHFTFPEIVRHQIARTRGDLRAENLLGQLAWQFGHATGKRGALRDAIGRVDPETGEWQPHKVDPDEINRQFEPHTRGAILVGALFDAFVTMYQRRTADLCRIATGGTGVLPQGQLHPDLVNRLADEAAKTAQHILRICIRALDYSSPIDPTFGEYLRALVTADYDLVPDDRYGYRLALIDAFRRRGIFPTDVQSMSVESLLWDRPYQEVPLDVQGASVTLSWDLRRPRKDCWTEAQENRSKIHERLTRGDLPWRRKAEQAFGLCLGADPNKPNVPPTVYRSEDGKPLVEVHSARPARRVAPGGTFLTELIVEITQRRRAYYDANVQQKVDAGTLDVSQVDEPHFEFRGGCTLVVDGYTGRHVRYAIFKRVDDDRRLQRQRDFYLRGPSMSLAATYLRQHRCGSDDESQEGPFALLHADV